MVLALKEGVFIPIAHDAPVYRIPWANYALILFNGVLFFLGANGGTRQILAYAIDPGNLVWYQFVTSAFLHADFVHLLGNMIFLWVFGNGVNDRMGHWKYLVAYFVLAILASLGHVLFGGERPAIGASGAVCGIVGLFFILMPRTEIKVLILYYRIAFVDIAAAWMIGFWFLGDLVLAIFFGPLLGVAYAAHVAGYLGGALIGSGLVKAKLIEDHGEDIFTPTVTGTFEERMKEFNEKKEARRSLGATPLYDPLEDRVRRMR